MTTPPLPPIGSADYLPSLLSALSAHRALAGWAPPPDLFALVLLACILGKGGVIVDVRVDVAEGTGSRDAVKGKGREAQAQGRRSKRRREIAGVVGVVQGILSGLMGKETRLVALSAQSTPTDLVAALRAPPSALDESATEPLSGPSHSGPDGQAPLKGSTAPSFVSASSRPPDDPSMVFGPARTRSRLSLLTTTSATSTSASAYVSAPSTPLARSPALTPTVPSLLPSPMPSRSPSPARSDVMPRPSNSSVPAPPQPIRQHIHPHLDTHLHSDQSALPPPAGLICTGLENADPTVLTKLVDFLRTSRIRGEGADPNPTGGKGYDASTERWGGCLVWVREEGAKTPTWLTDQFVLSLSVSPASLDPPPPSLLASTSAAAPPLPRSTVPSLRSLLPFIHIHPPLQRQLTNLSSALNVHPRLKLILSGQGTGWLGDLVRGARILRGSLGLPETWERGMREREALERLVDGASGEAGKRGVEGVGVRDQGYGAEWAGFNKAGGQSTKMRERREVDSWGIRAGEEPSIASLWRPGRAPGSGYPNTMVGPEDSTNYALDNAYQPFGQTPEHGTTAEPPALHGLDGAADAGYTDANAEEDDADSPRPEFVDPYCTPEDLRAVWFAWARHRCGWREGRSEVLWLINPARADRAALGLGMGAGPGEGGSGESGKGGTREAVSGSGRGSRVRGSKGKKEGNAEEVRRVEEVLREVWGVV